MIPSRGGKAVERAVAGSPVVLPAFLVPAVRAAPRRLFSHTPSRPSKVGRTPITIPPGVEFTIGEPFVREDPTTYLKPIRRIVTVAGPLGRLDLEIPPYIRIHHDETTRRAQLSVDDRQIRQQREMWGTTRACLQGNVTGVSEGHTAVLRLVGIGYRASVEERPKKAQFPGQKFVCLKLGHSHPIEEPVPPAVQASTTQPTRILLEGANREEVMSLAARIRRWRVPEPYKGKGVFVNNETIKLKQKKIK